MSGDNKIVGLWRDREELVQHLEPEPHVVEADEDAETFDTDETEWDYLDEPEEAGRWKRPVALGAALLGSAAWVGLLGYTQYVGLGGRVIALTDIVSFVATASAPLALIGVGWLALLRNSRSEARRFAATIEDLHSEEARLNETLTSVSARISQSRMDLAGATDSIANLGDDAVGRLSAVGESMRGEIETLGRHTTALKNSAAAARADMAVLLSDLPKAQIQTRQMASSLQEAGLEAHKQAGSLEAQLAALAAKGRDAQDVAGGAAERLAAHLARMESVSETAGSRLEEAAGQMTNAVDGALERAAAALATAREGMEAQGAAMRAMVEQAQASLQSAGSDSSDALSQRVVAISEHVDRMARTLAEQDEAARAMLARIGGEIDDLGQRFTSFGDRGTAKADELSAAISTLTSSNDALQASLEKGGATANTLIERAETLLTALDASSRELDESLPQAYDRLNAKAETSIARTRAMAPEIDAIEKAAAAALDRLMEAEGLLAKQRTALDGLVAGAGTSLADSREAVEALAASIEDAETRANALTEGAGPKLVEALVRVKETASQAAQHSREAFANIIPHTAEALSAKSREALEAAITQQVEEKLADVARNAENAVQAAQRATDRLMRQMLTIAETSAALEGRIAEAKAEVTEADQSTFSRRMALLIESLNSTAIDVTKLLSNEVTDTAWASYLRGDRGVFTRRAVRLLDSTELKEIQRHYDEEPDFRDHVNRYIHDFEAMLRQVLSTREGQSLSVTLLSSDAGKLYVALAQAIERLRN